MLKYELSGGICTMEEKPIVAEHICEQEFKVLDELYNPDVTFFSSAIEFLKTRGFSGRQAFYIFTRWTKYRDARLHLAKATNLFD